VWWLSLIRSLIRLRPVSFGAHHAGHAPEVTDVPDLCRTQPRRLGKRVGDDDDSPCEHAAVRLSWLPVQLSVLSEAVSGRLWPGHVRCTVAWCPILGARWERQAVRTCAEMRLP